MPEPDSHGFDVAIAGAGLAGASLALRLARAGASVALLDPSRFPREKLCGEYLSPEGALVLERLGLAGSVVRSGSQEIRRVRVTTPRGNRLEAEVVADDGRPGLGLSRSALDEMLVREARCAGAEVFEEARVGSPLVEGGRVVGLQSRSFAIRATITVAANGRHSSLVKLSGKTRGRSWCRPNLFGLKRHLSSPDGDATEPIGTVGLHLVPGGYVGTCRIEGGLTNLCGLLPESILKAHRGDLDRLAADHFTQNPVLDRLWKSSTATGDWKTVSGVRVETSRPLMPGIFYAGDCQGTIDPLGGQGMTMALLGAEMLAPVILDALAHEGADRAIQEAWQTAWRRRFDSRIRLCRAFHHALINPWLIDGLAASRSLAPKLLTACYNRTRDHRAVPAILPGAERP